MSKTQEQELKIKLTNDFTSKWGKKPHFLNMVLLAKQLPCAISLKLSSTPTRLQTAPSPVLVEVGFLLAIQTSAAQCPLINPLDASLKLSVHHSVFYAVLILARNFFIFVSLFKKFNLWLRWVFLAE